MTIDYSLMKCEIEEAREIMDRIPDTTSRSQESLAEISLQLYAMNHLLTAIAVSLAANHYGDAYPE